MLQDPNSLEQIRQRYLSLVGIDPPFGYSLSDIIETIIAIEECRDHELPVAAMTYMERHSSHSWSVEAAITSTPTIPHRCVEELHADWQREPDPQRPLYDCPECHEHAMQYYMRLAASEFGPERCESFVCCACGRSWQI